MPAQIPATVSGDSTFAEAAALTFKSADGVPVRGTSQEACLVHVYPPDSNTGRRYLLGAGPVVIGRGDDCTIRNTDSSVSRYHARITPGADGRFSVADLGSTNGTFVNNASRRVSALADGDYLRVGNCIYRFLAGRNIEAEYQEEIYRLTILDGLTQVYNRRYFTEFLEREAGRAARHQRSLAVLLLGLDRLQLVNDTLGHLAGDMALREVCARVRHVLRPDELLARSGGAQFATVLPEGDADSARATAERIRLVIEKQPFAFITRGYRLTLSVGAAVLPPGETHPSGLAEGTSPAATLQALAAANLARAKAAGGNRVVVS
jgi:diguanylate cyclase (GGDEF)-like protein